MIDKQKIMVLKYASKMFKLKQSKFVILALLLCFQSFCLNGQSNGKVTRVVTYDNLKLVGKILEDNADEIVLVLDIVEDTITIDKSIIKTYYHLNDQYKFYADNGGYHRKTGWVNSLGYHVGNFAQYRYAGGQLSLIFDYSLYKLITPKLGLGGGIGYKSLITGGELGQENYPRFNFIELNAYGKMYLSDSQRRLFVDAKIGYGIAGSDIKYYTYVDEGFEIFNYPSGYMLQPGFGFEFARNRRLRSGIKISAFFNHRARGETKSISYKYYKGVMFGFNFYY